MEKLDIKEYSYVLAVYEEGGISAAAEKLYISQPSLSVYIKNLEDRLGIKFFDRRDGKYVLTFEGEKYIEYGKQILSLNENLARELEEIKESKAGRVRLGIMLSRGTYTIPKLMSAIKQEYPQIEVKVIEDSQINLENLLYDGKIDLALINYPFRSHDFNYSYICSSQVVLVVPKNNPICSLATVVPNSPYKHMDLRFLSNEEFILLKSGRALRKYADALFTQSGINPKILFETSLITTAYQTACAKVGVTFTYASQYDLYPSDNVEIFSVGNPITSTDYVVAYNEKRKLTPAQKLVFDLIIKELEGSTW